MAAAITTGRHEPRRAARVHLLGGAEERGYYDDNLPLLADDGPRAPIDATGRAPTARRCAPPQDAVIAAQHGERADRRRPPVLAHRGRAPRSTTSASSTRSRSTDFNDKARPVPDHAGRGGGASPAASACSRSSPRCSCRYGSAAASSAT